MISMLFGCRLSQLWVALVGLCGIGFSWAQENHESAQIADKPNIIVLFADDLGYGDLGSFGHPYNRTPHIDTLAAQGQRWTDFYAAAPVCSPSRGALLTGRLPIRTGLYGENIAVYFPNDPGGFPDRELTLAELLRDQGYRTGIFGKWHLGDAKPAWPTRGWSAPPAFHTVLSFFAPESQASSPWKFWIVRPESAAVRLSACSP